MSDSERKPKHHIPGEKVAILRRHLIDKVPVSNLCEECGVHPTVFYRWLKQFFENGAAAFAPAPRADKQVGAREQRIALANAPATSAERNAHRERHCWGLSPGVRQTVKTLFALRWNCIVLRMRFPSRCAPAGLAPAPWGARLLLHKFHECSEPCINS